MMAARWGLSRQQLDEFALASHERAAAAQDAGEFDDEIVPIAGIKADEGIRRDTTLEKLGTLKTPFKPDGVVTAGSASQISDGAAALAITTSDWAAAHGLTPLVRIHTRGRRGGRSGHHVDRSDPRDGEGASARRHPY